MKTLFYATCRKKKKRERDRERDRERERERERKRVECFAANGRLYFCGTSSPWLSSFKWRRFECTYSFLTFLTSAPSCLSLLYCLLLSLSIYLLASAEDILSKALVCYCLLVFRGNGEYIFLDLFSSSSSSFFLSFFFLSFFLFFLFSLLSLTVSLHLPCPPNHQSIIYSMHILHRSASVLVGLQWFSPVAEAISCPLAHSCVPAFLLWVCSLPPQVKMTERPTRTLADRCNICME